MSTAMGVRVRITGEGERVVENVSSVRELLSRVGLVGEEVVVLRNGVILTEDDELSDGDEVIVYVVKSGG
ncbi:MoaD/ThiS family protein [Thermogladius sp. KZ2Tp1]|uniref:MoaD/ThiS family protein n=1 Tax=Thermogladius sp. KZ2Tp1 TaxID=3136289 RepID=UPI003DA8E5C2